MKKLSISFVFLFAGLFAFAQQNVVKVGLGSAFQRDLQIKYERSFGEKHSFQIGILADFTESLDNESFTRLTRGLVIEEPFEIGFGGFAIIPEYRFYFSQAGSPRGFYLGAYGRYRQRNFSIDSNFGTDIGIDAGARVWNVGGGLGMGAQFLIADKFVIDWYIAGLGYNQFFTSATIAPANDGDFERLQMDLLREIDDYSYQDLGVDEGTLSMEDFNATKQGIRDAVANTEVREFNIGNLTSGFIDIRIGLSLGYAF